MVDIIIIYWQSGKAGPGKQLCNFFFIRVSRDTDNVDPGSEDIACLQFGKLDGTADQGDSLAILFGDTSPKIRTTMVVTTVETLAPASSPRKRTKMSVEREAQPCLFM